MASQTVSLCLIEIFLRGDKRFDMVENSSRRLSQLFHFSCAKCSLNHVIDDASGETSSSNDFFFSLDIGENIFAAAENYLFQEQLKYK